MIEVLIASCVKTMIDANEGFTPTPLISHAILGYNRSRTRGLGDGIVITPSHNPPRDGGLKYSAPHGGPADAATTGSIERTANDLLTSGLASVRRIPYERARAAAELQRHNYVTAYVADFASVLEMSAIAAAGVSIGIEPLGGAAVKFWEPIIDRYGLNAHRQRRDRSDLRVHDRRLGRADPDGLFVTLRDDAAGRVARRLRCRFRQRYRRRSARRRRALAGVDEPQSISGDGSLLPALRVQRLAEVMRDRQDDGDQCDA